MSELKVNSSFISEKAAKVRWIPEQYAAPQSFVTGSWSFNVNSIKLWKLGHNDYTAAATIVSADDNNGDAALNADCVVPKCTAKISVSGDVTGLEFIDFENIVMGSSDGFVSLLNINRNLANDNLSEVFRYKNLHRFSNSESAPCTALSVFENNVATVGEDGRLNILSLSGQNVIKSIDNCDSCTVNCVSFINHKELLTGNRMGIIKMFDIRTDSTDPAETMMISCDDEKKSNAVTVIAYHPTQKHIVLSGSEEGSITVWDLRQPNYPASYLTVHESSAITDLSFHPTEPTKLFTASEAGDLFQWSHASGHIVDDGGQLRFNNESENVNPWLSGERTKNRINWTPLINGLRKPINSFDVAGSKIISSCENEAVYLIENIC